MILKSVESAVLTSAIMAMTVGIDRLELRLMGMPSKEEAASATGVRAALGLVRFQIYLFAGKDLYILEHPFVEIDATGMAEIDMVLTGVCSTVDAIVTAVESALVTFVLMLIGLVLPQSKRE